MQTRLAWILCFAVGLACAEFGPFASSAYAQRPDRDEDDEDRGRGGERWGRFRGSRENGGDGDNGERSERRRRFLERRESAGEGGDDGERRGRDRGDEDRNREDDNDEDRERGRGGEGRGRRGGGRMDYSEYARNLVRDNDKNGNMILDGEEVNQLRGPAALADANGDKSITVEEIVARLSNRESSAGRQERKSDDGESAAASESKTGAASEDGKTRVYTWLGNGPAGQDSKENAQKRKSYRFTPASERWGSASSRIKSRDRNDDGQVSMSEYSRTWSARTVREFQRYDSDSDGVITPKEATTDSGDEE